MNITRRINQALESRGFVRVVRPHHHDRGYTLKHHKQPNYHVINIFFNSSLLMEEAQKILKEKGIESSSHHFIGVFLQIEVVKD